LRWVAIVEGIPFKPNQLTRITIFSKTFYHQIPPKKSWEFCSSKKNIKKLSTWCSKKSSESRIQFPSPFFWKIQTFDSAVGSNSDDRPTKLLGETSICHSKIRGGIGTPACRPSQDTPRSRFICWLMFLNKELRGFLGRKRGRVETSSPSLHMVFESWPWELPRTCLFPLLGLQPSKRRPFPIKTMVIWVLGITNSSYNATINQPRFVCWKLVTLSRCF